MTGEVVVTIDGRSALPLRALPYITAWAEAPDSLVSALAMEATVRVGEPIQRLAGRRVEIVNRHALTAYRMANDGSWAAIPPSQWQSVAVELSSLTVKLRADERPNAEDENHARWRVEATLVLPDDVFVWFEEFQRWFLHTRPLAIPTDDDQALWRVEQTKLYNDEDLALILDEGMCDFSRPGSIELVVILPNELSGKLWRFVSAVPFQEPGASSTPTSRGGRPPSQERKAAVLSAIMKRFADVDAIGPDPMSLPGSLADLLDACQRIEKSVTGNEEIFSVSEDTFRVWLAKAGFGFATGRRPKSQNQSSHWTRSAPAITGKTLSGVFSAN